MLTFQGQQNDSAKGKTTATTTTAKKMPYFIVKRGCFSLCCRLVTERIKIDQFSRGFSPRSIVQLSVGSVYLDKRSSQIKLVLRSAILVDEIVAVRIKCYFS